MPSSSISIPVGDTARSASGSRGPVTGRSVISRLGGGSARLARSTSASQSVGGSQFSVESGPDPVVGSFTNTTEEIRDGSARLASMSMSLSMSSPLVDPPGGSSRFQSFSPSGWPSRPRDVSERRPSSSERVSPASSGVAASLALGSGPDVPEHTRKASEPSQSTFRTPFKPSLGPIMPSGVSTPEEPSRSRADSPSERTPLLPGPPDSKKGHPLYSWIRGHWSAYVAQVPPTQEIVSTAVASLPAVFLGVLMNVLDGVSYGMIMFPTFLPPFASFGGIGVSLFFVSCIVSQLVYTLGGSVFKGGNGSMMIEVVPFFHILASDIARSAPPEKIVPTTMLAFALASILTGLFFLLLGYARLGRLAEFFPRHILVGCIGGVGAFLVVTGFQVSSGLEGGSEEGLIDGVALSQLTSSTLQTLLSYLSPARIPLWAIPLVLAILLKGLSSRYSHPFLFPGFFLAIPLVFYGLTLGLLRIPLDTLRAHKWVFAVEGVDSKWYEPWLLFDLKQTDFKVLFQGMSTQLALVFFGLLHVPINVPALGISIGEDDVDTDRELVAHGFSNILSGVFGSVPNYLCYVNSVLFYRLGGTTRISSFLLAVACCGVLVAGPGVIGYLPVCVVGALIFILGIDLLKEAVYDTKGRVSTAEYITIWVIVATMVVYDFVIGIGVGVILACFNFVFWGSRRHAIRSILTGDVAKSTVRRHPAQKAFLQEAGQNLVVVRLQGFLFFGTISRCENEIRAVVDQSDVPPQFVVLDFSHASGVDFSAAEAFVRVQRYLESKDTVLVFCGCEASSPVGSALRQVGLWPDTDEEGASLVIFETLNDALEHCENMFLRTWYLEGAPSLSKRTTPHSPTLSLRGMDLLREAGRRVSVSQIGLQYSATSPSIPSNSVQPVPILSHALSPFSPDITAEACFSLSRYFSKKAITRNETLWSVGDPATHMYIIESGVLKATYFFSKNRIERAARSLTLDTTALQGEFISESMLAGTLAGEMSFLSRTPRNTQATVERDAVLWELSTEKHDEMKENESPELVRVFENVLMRIALEEADILMNYLISNL